MKARNRIAVPVAALIIVAGQAASAQEADIQSLISPNEQSIELGVIGVLGSARTSGMYTGLDDIPALPIANGTFIHRDEQTGIWLQAIGTDLGFGSRGLRLEYERQGKWKYFFEFNQIHKSNPLEVITGLTGTDGNVQTVNGTALRELDLSTDRYNGKLGINRRFSKEIDLKVSFKSEYKNGKRQFGNRTNGQNIFFLVDPIDQYVHEIDARLNYVGKSLQLTAGFLGNLFVNKDKVLINDANAGGTQNPQIALPPDNHALNIYLNGGYNFTPTTRGAFKLSYNEMKQNDSFFRGTGGLGGNVRTDLGGEVENYLAMGSVNSRVGKNLRLKGKVRYEGRQDNTPVEQYVSVRADRDGTNAPFDRDRVVADGEATYRLPDDYRLTGAVKYEYWKRSFPALRQSSWRERTHEYSGRAQLGKRLTDSLGGRVAYIYSIRDGSAFLPSNSTGITNIIDPIHWGNRERNQWRLNLDWEPTDKLSIQVLVDGSLDTYHSDERPRGPQNGQSHNAAIDAAYQLTRDWSLTAFVSRNEIKREQQTFDNNGGIRGPWTANLNNLGYAGGIGIQGRPRDRLKLGANIQYSHDMMEYELASTNPAIVDLPDVTYRQIDLNLQADYALSDNSSVKVRYNFIHLANDEFSYDVNIFQGGTRINLPNRENTHFIGLSFVYHW
jgi:MtrB/PioB family decaheme-associated outer membrane protein